MQNCGALKIQPSTEIKFKLQSNALKFWTKPYLCKVSSRSLTVLPKDTSEGPQRLNSSTALTCVKDTDRSLFSKDWISVVVLELGCSKDMALLAQVQSEPYFSSGEVSVVSSEGKVLQIN